jgi:hypothetical protein
MCWNRAAGIARHPKEYIMKKRVPLLALALLLQCGVALAATCEAQATDKKLAGAAKTSFMKKCEADAAAAGSGGASAACEKSAADKKLAGAAKTSHIKKCMADAGGAGGDTAAAMCEKSAADKKLAGAAKDSHVKKCLADAKPQAKAEAKK